jgi:hypothetical protein
VVRRSSIRRERSSCPTHVDEDETRESMHSLETPVISFRVNVWKSGEEWKMAQSTSTSAGPTSRAYVLRR